ncbi:unnamed protein product [Cuscuta europaea]|uniref:Uncharacterized protein n=1 Tax=Cuscuta europaea TaxID=41803 RepID=A0A9P0ZQP1_CUSEU|nr:unnamed protein product [Cuscuta europaea]
MEFYKICDIVLQFHGIGILFPAQILSDFANPPYEQQPKVSRTKRLRSNAATVTHRNQSTRPEKELRTPAGNSLSPHPSPHRISLDQIHTTNKNREPSSRSIPKSEG